MPLWQILLVVAVAGIAATGIRILTTRLSERPVRRTGPPPGALKSAHAIGIPEGQGLQVWIPAGKQLPATCRRVIRVSSTQGDTVPLSFHTDGPALEPLIEIEIGPIDRSTQNVRLVEVVLRVAADGRLKVTALVRSSDSLLPVKIVGPPSAARRTVRVPSLSTRSPSQD